jgi:hypothetical protein
LDESVEEFLRRPSATLNPVHLPSGVKELGTLYDSYTRVIHVRDEFNEKILAWNEVSVKNDNNLAFGPLGGVTEISSLLVLRSGTRQVVESVFSGKISDSRTTTVIEDEHP